MLFRRRSSRARPRFLLMGVSWPLIAWANFGFSWGVLAYAQGNQAAASEGTKARKTASQPEAPIAGPAKTPTNNSTGKPPAKPQLSPDQVSKRNSLIQRANQRRGEGKLVEAIELAVQVNAMEREVFGDQSLYAAGSYAWIADMQETAEEFSAAEKSRQSALEILTAMFGEKDYRVTDARWALRSTEILSRLDAPGCAELARGRGMNARVLKHVERGEDAAAVPLAQESLAIRRKALGGNHPEHAQSLYNLAELYRKMGDYIRAEPLYRQSLEIRKNTDGEGLFLGRKGATIDSD